MREICTSGSVGGVGVFGCLPYPDLCPSLGADGPDGASEPSWERFRAAVADLGPRGPPMPSATIPGAPPLQGNCRRVSLAASGSPHENTPSPSALRLV